MKTKIQSTPRSQEFMTQERCAILELSNDSEDADVSIAQARVAPGVTTAWHHLKGVAERYLILEGTGRVEIGNDEAADVGPSAVVRIPPQVRQRITNTGTTDLVFLAICTPRFTPDCYVDLEA